MRRPVAISLSPNAEKDDVLLTLKVLFSPTAWFNFRETEKLEREFARMFGKTYHALAVNSGRSALYLILKTLGIGQDDEVALQALTCVAVPNSILWLNANPIYVDVDDSMNMDPNDLSKKISKKTKAIIVQHSFGIPASIQMIKKVAKKRRIPVIEDCALALGAKYKNKLLGTYGDVSFYSFGRDKVISSVFGGMILCKDKKLYEELLNERNNLSYPSMLWVVQQLLHPLLFSIILPFYNVGLGKITLGKAMLFLFQKLGLLSRAVYEEEKSGEKPEVFPSKLPGALSILALNQLGKIERFNNHRKEIADLYFQKIRGFNMKLPYKNEEAIWVRFPIVYENAKSIYNYTKGMGVLLGNWYKEIVMPVNKLALVRYESGSCPNAEEYAGKILNLPTYPSLSKMDAERVVQLIKSCLSLK